MELTRQSVEILAPVGNWDVLEAAIGAGADAVYLGGKRFNMRMHRTDTNFDDEKLARAIAYAHERNVKLYVTVNNLISDREMPGMRQYLELLQKLQPDALIVQDLSILQLAKETGFTVPLHASVMMNTHNEHAVRQLQAYGLTRVVTNREMTLDQLRLLKERTGIEIEYFIHGDMCIAQSGQCIHSGVLFGQSSNRGRCLKPCRWPYQLVDAQNGDVLESGEQGPFKLALKDMCLYNHLPELIQAGVCSFKIEGRMRTADFVSNIVRLYSSAIDRYFDDPTGYYLTEKEWQEMQESRSRDFSTCYSFGNPGAAAVGYTGEREPRFFSQAVVEPGLDTPIALPKQQNNADFPHTPTLSVRVADRAAAAEALANGANILYVGGESFLPHRPWTKENLKILAQEAHAVNAKVVVAAPRITLERECSEWSHLFKHAAALGLDGLMVSSIGMLRLAKEHASLPIYGDLSLNLFNGVTAKWLHDNGLRQGTVSAEATCEQIWDLCQHTPLPLEMIVHGPLEAMVMDHHLPEAILGLEKADADRAYGLLDTAGQIHPIAIDQYERNHVLFAKDLCLLPFLSALTSVGSYRIEGQHYAPALVGKITKAYRKELDELAAKKEAYAFSTDALTALSEASPRPLGIGAFRYRISR